MLCLVIHLIFLFRSFLLFSILFPFFPSLFQSLSVSCSLHHHLRLFLFLLFHHLSLSFLHSHLAVAPPLSHTLFIFISFFSIYSSMYIISLSLFLLSLYQNLSLAHFHILYPYRFLCLSQSPSQFLFNSFSFYHCLFFSYFLSISISLLSFLSIFI